MRQRLIDAAPRHYVAAEKNLHRPRSFREADRDIGCSSLSGWPNGAERFGRSGDHILDLARRQAGRKQSENGAGDRFRINAWIAIHRFVKASAQRVEALRGPMHAGMPTFIIETAQQWRQLCAEIDNLVAWQRVAKSVQRANQSRLGFATIMPIQARRQIVDPRVRLRDGATELPNCSQPTGPCVSIYKRSQSSSFPDSIRMSSTFSVKPRRKKSEG